MTFVVCNNQPVSIYNSNTIFCGQFRNRDWPFRVTRFPKKFTRRKQWWTTKISFDAFDLRNDGCLASVKTKTISHAQYLMANRWFSRYVIAAMLVDENKRFLISSFCSSTSNCTLQHCYLCPSRLAANHLYWVFKILGISGILRMIVNNYWPK